MLSLKETSVCLAIIIEKNVLHNFQIKILVNCGLKLWVLALKQSKQFTFFLLLKKT